MKANIHRFSHLTYRIAINVFVRAIRSLMRVRGDFDGHFCVGSNGVFYERDGLRFTYHIPEYGAGGNIDSGGNTESQTRNKLFSLLKNNPVFYDVGAHEGLYAISLKKQFPNATIYAFDPHPNALKENLILNGIDDIVVHGVAIGHEISNVAMTVGERSSDYIVLNDRNRRTIQMMTLDKIIADQGLSKPDAIKLDIEGFELHALRGARTILTSSKPLVITEINHCFLRYFEDLSEFTTYMESLGFQLHSLCKGTLSPIHKEIHALSDLPPSADSNYWWLPT